MARRPVFVPEPDGHYLVRETLVDFEWHPGFSVAQKQRSVRALHEAARRSQRHERILEVSTKSNEPLGRQLSAFELQKSLPDDSFRTCLEAAFQASKVFLDGDHRTQLSEIYSNRDARDVKRIMRPWRSIPLEHFRFGAEEWPLEPKSAFYDWLYVRALCEHERSSEIQREITQYDAFTDIEFNPKKSFNCQARSCALFAALAWRSALDQTETRSMFLRLLANHDYGCTLDALLPSSAQEDGRETGQG